MRIKVASSAYPLPVRIAVAVLFLNVMTAATGFAAPIDTCLSVSSTTSLQTEALQKLVETELARFPSHQFQRQNCTTTLFVETFPFAEKKYLTLRVSGEVPVRYAYFSTEELVHNLQKGLRLVLGNDPVYLKENISQYSVTQRALHSVKIKGSTTVRLELMESITRTGQGVSYGPGIAGGLYKGSANLYIFSRIYASMQLPSATSHPISRPVAVGLDAGFNYEFADARRASPYLGAGLGLGFVRFEGQVNQKDQSVNSLLVQGFLRTGIRLFRLTAFDMDLFATAYLPFNPASNVDSTLLGKDGRAYTPQIQMGIGVGF